MVTTTALMAAASVALILGILGIVIDRKRVERLSLLSGSLEFRMHKGRDYRVLKTLPDFELLEGENLYVANVSRGIFDGLDVTAFDFHSEQADQVQGRQKPRHLYYACFIAPCQARDMIIKDCRYPQESVPSTLLNNDFTQFLDGFPGLYLEVKNGYLLMASQGRILPNQFISHLDNLNTIVQTIQQQPVNSDV